MLQQAAQEHAQAAAEAERDWQVEVGRRGDEVAALQAALAARPSHAEVGCNLQPEGCNQTISIRRRRHHSNQLAGCSSRRSW